MDDLLRKALDALPVAALTREQWVNVGMALKHEGCSCSEWDDWSRKDSRYRAGECERLWNGFHGSASPVTAGTVVQLAKEHGFVTVKFENKPLGWDDYIEYDGECSSRFTPSKAPYEELIEYLETLFYPEEYIGYVTDGVYLREEDKRWLPGKGVYHRTAGEVIASLKKYKDDMGFAIGDTHEEAGAWIRFNPLDGEGVGNQNVTRFRYALVESDTMPIADQEFIYRKLELPIACMVSSGGKSIHAIVKVDAADADEYRKRVGYLYEFLGKQGIDVDRQNSNPSRLSRMPGIMRNGKLQHLIATNIGRPSWVSWMDFAEGEQDEMPDIVMLPERWEDLPPMAPELIGGVLRQGHKMIISGPSKAGKSFLLVELAIAIAEGREWLGFPCCRSKVLYLNLEIDAPSFFNRCKGIYDIYDIVERRRDNLLVWNLRGRAKPLVDLVPVIIRRIRDEQIGAIIFDPIYKILMGDENNASEMGSFCNQFDRICDQTGASAIYCHHHSKGAQGSKKAMDRSSGSGVFARDPDAIIDITPLEMSEDFKANVWDHHSYPFRMEGSLREFPSFEPKNFYFQTGVGVPAYHYLDTTGELAKLYPEGSAGGNFEKSSKRAKACSNTIDNIDMSFANCSLDGLLSAKLSEMAQYMEVTDKTLRGWINSTGAESYYIQNGYVYKKSGNR